MMARFILVFVPLFISVGCQQGLHGQQVIPRREEIPGLQLDAIAAHIDGLPDNTQLSIALINDSIATFLGFLRAGGEWQVTENRDSVFEIGSITKVFTSTLLAALASEGRIDLDEEISAMLPYRAVNLEKDGVPITLKTLANHTSGLPRLPANLMPLISQDPDNPYSASDNRTLQGFFDNHAALSQVPGSRYEYSNLGAAVLGYLMELRTGRSYEDLLQELVFSRYGMTSSTTRRGNIASRLVKGRGLHGEVVRNWDMGAFQGAGAILSTTRDISCFVMANFSEDSVLAIQREKTFRTGKNSGIALGWHFIEQDGDTWYWHNGATGGYRSQLVMDTGNRKAVAILSNVSGNNPMAGQIDQLGFNLQETMLLYDNTD